MKLRRRRKKEMPVPMKARIPKLLQITARSAFASKVLVIPEAARAPIWKIRENKDITLASISPGVVLDKRVFSIMLPPPWTK